MKNKILFIFILCICHTIIFAQGTWTNKANFPGIARHEAVGFSIGNKGYLGTGRDGSIGNFKDFWEYDPASDTWSQKADFSGGERYKAVGFSIGSKGYIGTGADVNFKKDFWEYNPTSNSWSRKADFGGTARYDAFGFSIGNKGYLGTGTDGSTTKDFWEYDPVTDQWNAKKNFGGTPRSNAISFTINNKGYVGGGGSSTDFWIYDPASDSWTLDTPFATTAAYSLSAFSTSSKGYIKYILNGETIFKEYNPSDHTWSLKESFPEISNQESVNFSVNEIGYIATGTKAVGYSNHVWQYEPCRANVQGITSFCQGESTILTANEGTSYLWSNGDVTQSTTINSPGDYTVTVNQSTGCGTTTTSKAVAIDYVNPSASISYNNGYGCQGQKVSFTSELSCIEATSWEWDFGDPSSGTANNSILENPDHIFSGNPAYQTYTISLTINNTYTTSKNIYINTSPVADLGEDRIIYQGELITLDSGYPMNQWGIYNWSTGENGPTIEVSSAGTYHVEVCTDEFLMGMCCVSDTIQVTLVLDLDEENKNSSLYSLSPNPASEYFTLNCKTNLENASITLYNIYGQEVLKIEGIDGNTITIQRENLPNGFYLIRLNQGKNLFTEKLIIKE